MRSLLSNLNIKGVTNDLMLYVNQLAVSMRMSVNCERPKGEQRAVLNHLPRPCHHERSEMISDVEQVRFIAQIFFSDIFCLDYSPALRFSSNDRIQNGRELRTTKGSAERLLEPSTHSGSRYLPMGVSFVSVNN